MLTLLRFFFMLAITQPLAFVMLIWLTAGSLVLGIVGLVLLFT